MRTWEYTHAHLDMEPSNKFRPPLRDVVLQDSCSLPPTQTHTVLSYCDTNHKTEEKSRTSRVKRNYDYGVVIPQKSGSDNKRKDVCDHTTSVYDYCLTPLTDQKRCNVSRTKEQVR